MAELPSETRIILVDDAAAVRSVLRMLLSSEGYKIVGDFGTGANLLTSIARLRPHIVCLDVNLPDSDGITLLTEIHSAYPETAVVMITGSDDPSLELDAASAGATGFIHKPFSQDKIIKELRQVAEAQQLMAAACSPGEQQRPGEVLARAVIADDSATMRRLLAVILAQAGIEVVAQACNGVQAAELVGQHCPEIVCLDIDMPVMNGVEALKLIHAKHPTAKVLMITANANRSLFSEAARSGAKGYILKPYRPDKVIQAIGQLLQMK